MICFAVVLVVGLGLMLYKNTRQDFLIQKCEADVLYKIYENGEQHTLDALYVLALSARNQGFLHVTGVLSRNGKKEEIDRTYNFTFKKSGKVGLYGVQISREKISTYDSVDSVFFHTYFFPYRPGEDLYIKSQYLEDNLYLFEGFSYPFFICNEGG